MCKLSIINTGIFYPNWNNICYLFDFVVHVAKFCPNAMKHCCVIMYIGIVTTNILN